MEVGKITLIRTETDQWNLTVTAKGGSVFPFTLNKDDMDRLARQSLRAFNPVGHDLTGIGTPELTNEVKEFQRG